ncbi:MAG: hypothetical protein J7641_12245 [Cyanobacteria bacterium SID2]|nr:hypothetical protein [Cyanobacteria bacterium SID2]MBP0006027.1 hypothetical protein [Cyanobacteria bacterium SBC]
MTDCLARNSQRTGRAKIPEVGVRSTYRKLEIPELSEGFDRLFSVEIDRVGRFVISEWNLS